MGFCAARAQIHEMLIRFRARLLIHQVVQQPHCRYKEVWLIPQNVAAEQLKIIHRFEHDNDPKRKRCQHRHAYPGGEPDGDLCKINILPLKAEAAIFVFAYRGVNTVVGELDAL